jgi:uncharacterized protein YutE (UPF0331/DUF86 family)
MTVTELEQQKLNEIAADYSRQGFLVQIKPEPNALPVFLRRFEPDIVATSRDESVVVEITSPSGDRQSFKNLAEAVEAQNGWRLEVVFVNQPVAPDVPAQEDLAPEEEVGPLLASAEALFAEGEVKAAAMLAWSAVEIILRRDARAIAPEIERQSSSRVLKHLYSLGHVRPTAYEKLLRLMEFRNAVAHGFQPSVTLPPILEIVSEIRQLQHAA